MANPDSALPHVIQYMQGTVAAPATTNGNGLNGEGAGYKTQNVEILEVGGGTATVTLQGSFDGNHWYALGFEQTDAQATLTRSVSTISVTGNTAHVYSLLDYYNHVRAVISSISSASIIVRIHLWP